jgi:Predicted membrane protein
VSDQQTAYVLVDGNNIEPGLRDMLVDAVQDRVTNAEILTTDTHVVNSVEASNQVGERVEATELRSLVVGLLDDAIADLEPVEAGMVTNRAEVTVFGNDRTESLASHANAMIQMGGALAVASAMAVTAISVLLFLFT